VLREGQAYTLTTSHLNIHQEYTEREVERGAEGGGGAGFDTLTTSHLNIHQEYTEREGGRDVLREGEGQALTHLSHPT